MQSTTKSDPWLRRLAVALAAASATWPTEAWAHGGMDGLGPLLVAIFIGGPVAVALLALGIVCLALAKGPNPSPKAAVAAKVARTVAVVAGIGVPIGQLLTAHRITAEVLTITGLTFVPLLALASFCFWAGSKALVPLPPR